MGAGASSTRIEQLQKQIASDSARSKVRPEPRDSLRAGPAVATRDIW
jgi:hypothetical protein